MMTPRQNLMAMLNGEMPGYVPNTFADVHLCGLFYSLDHPIRSEKDVFGVPWSATPEGSMPSPGFVMFDDIADWRDCVHFPDLDEVDFHAIAAAEAAAIPQPDQENVMYSLMLGCGIWERLVAFMGFENALMALVEDPEECAAFFDAMADFKIKLHNKLIDAYHPDILIMCDDLASANGMFMSPETYRQVIKPAHKKIIDACHARGVIYQFHCCGKCEAVIPDFVDMGVKMWQSAQPMNDLAGILDKYQGKLIVEGGWDSSGAPGYVDAPVEVLREETRRCLTEYKKPGFILLPSLFSSQGSVMTPFHPMAAIVMDEWKKHCKF